MDAPSAAPVLAGGCAHGWQGLVPMKCHSCCNCCALRALLPATHKGQSRLLRVPEVGRHKASNAQVGGTPSQQSLYRPMSDHAHYPEGPMQTGGGGMSVQHESSFPLPIWHIPHSHSHHLQLPIKAAVGARTVNVESATPMGEGGHGWK